VPVIFVLFEIFLSSETLDAVEIRCDQKNYWFDGKDPFPSFERKLKKMSKEK